MRRVCCLLLCLLAFVRPSWAFPTSSNLIPTADMLEAGSLRVEFENDGAPVLLRAEAERYALLQYAPSARLEVGLDLYSAGRANDPVFNLKWLAWPERSKRPALALGVLEVGPGYSPTTYLISTKDLGRGLRAHLGGASCAGSEALLLGGELQVRPNDYVLADWASWPSGYLSLGIYHEFVSGLGLNIAYAWPNADGESGLLLVNVSRTARWR